jgi:hypothetical protein
VRPAAGDLARPEQSQRPQRRRATHAVGDLGEVALEGPQRPLGLLVEDPTRPARVVAELEQPLLEGEDVVAAHRGGDEQCEHPVAEPPPGLAQLPVRGGADDAVGDEPAALLEGAHRVLERDVEMLLGAAFHGG